MLIDIDAVDAQRRRAWRISEPIRGGTYPGSCPRASPPGYPDHQIVDGWSKSLVHPNALFDAFPLLRLRPGMTLNAYMYLGSIDPRGFVYGMRDEDPFPEPWECMTEQQGIFTMPRRAAMDAAFRQWATQHAPEDFGELFSLPAKSGATPRPTSLHPVPPHTFEDLMDVADGDRSPSAYFSASMFAREAEEFACGRHEICWGHHMLLTADPWEDPRLADRISPRPRWDWYVSEPKHFAARVLEIDGHSRVEFFTHTLGIGESLFYHVDSYHQTGLRFDSSATIIARGPGGIMI